LLQSVREITRMVEAAWPARRRPIGRNGYRKSG